MKGFYDGFEGRVQEFLPEYIPSYRVWEGVVKERHRYIVELNDGKVFIAYDDEFEKVE